MSDNRESHTIAETRRFIREASVVYASIEIEFERNAGEWDADTLMMRITKKQAAEIVALLDKGSRPICEYDGFLLNFH